MFSVLIHFAGLCSLAAAGTVGSADSLIGGNMSPHDDGVVLWCGALTYGMPCQCHVNANHLLYPSINNRYFCRSLH